jgi:hypothetical protein
LAAYYLWVADPRQVTFLWTDKEKSPKEIRPGRFAAHTPRGPLRTSLRPGARRVEVRAVSGEKRRKLSRHPGACFFGYFLCTSKDSIPGCGAEHPAIMLFIVGKADRHSSSGEKKEK